MAWPDETPSVVSQPQAPPSDAELAQRVRALRELRRVCRLCPRQCRAHRNGSRAPEQQQPDRAAARTDGRVPKESPAAPLGYCRQPAALQLAVCCPHGGEEPALCGTGGSGTVFVVGCTMRCAFCQNYQLSHLPALDAWNQSPEQAAAAFLRLQAQGCHNIAWVSPTQHLPALLEAWRLARARGLRLPLVYNSNGYERPEVLELLAGIVDIYLPDAKYSDDALARRFSAAPDYVAISRRAILEMWRQVGPLELGSDGLARRGVLIRHLVLPGHVRNTEGVLEWIAQALGQLAWVSLMAQYYPAHLAASGTLGLPPLDRPLSRKEYRRAVDLLLAAGLERGWVQQRTSCRSFLPDFYRAAPFAGRQEST